MSGEVQNTLIMTKKIPTQNALWLKFLDYVENLRTMDVTYDHIEVNTSFNVSGVTSYSYNTIEFTETFRHVLRSTG